MNDRFVWTDFYRNVSGRQPREVALDVLARFEREPAAGPRSAIDLGCGDGTETALLLSRGWTVLATDGEPAAFDHLRAKIPAEAQARLTTQVARFEDVTLTAADLIYAGYSLPFCPPNAWDRLWSQVVNSIRPQGRFAGQLFGVRDTWAHNTDMTFFSAEGARRLFDGFEIERFEEEENDGASTAGPKHWHLFHIIARKP